MTCLRRCIKIQFFIYYVLKFDMENGQLCTLPVFFIFLSMENKGKEYNWSDVRMFMNGKEVHGIVNLQYGNLLSDLESKLLIAEENEEYELCAELKKKICEFKVSNK